MFVVPRDDFHPLYSLYKSKACDWLITGIRKEFTSKNTKEKISCGVGRTKEISHQRCMGWCEIRTCLVGCAKFAQAWLVVRNSHMHGAVVFRRPYLPHFSSKSYTVWSVRFFTSSDLKWYILCGKWTLGSAPKVWRKIAAAVLYFLHSVFLSPLLFPCILWTTKAKDYEAPKLGFFMNLSFQKLCHGFQITLLNLGLFWWSNY